MDFVVPINLEDLFYKSSDNSRYVVKTKLSFDDLFKDAIDRHLDGLYCSVHHLQLQMRVAS